MANERDEIVLKLLMFRQIESDLAGAASTRYVQAMIRELEDKLADLQRGIAFRAARSARASPSVAALGESC